MRDRWGKVGEERRGWKLAEFEHLRLKVFLSVLVKKRAK